MKKFSLFLAMLFATAFVFTSCNPDEELGSEPTISFTNNKTEYTVNPADAGNNTVVFNATIAAAEEIESFTVTTIKGEDQAVETVTGLDSKTAHVYAFEKTFTEADFANVTSIQYVFKVVDKADRSTTKTVTVTKTTGAGAIESFTAVLMGAQDNASEGSFLDAETGDVYLMAAAKTNQNLIDVVYYYGTTNLATLVAPSDPTVGGGTGNLDLCKDWTNPNSTKFYTTSGIVWEDVTDDTQIIAAATGTSSSKMNELAEDDIIAFETEGGKKGLIRVLEIVTGATGKITIDVKIQK